MNEKKRAGPTEFKTEAERFHGEGKLPKLEDLLSVVTDVRKEYAPRILEARKLNEGEDDASNS